MALEIVAILQRFLVEKPLTTRPNREDFAWKWERREQPLRELYLDAFFGQCFGAYAAVKRQGLDRASKRDIAYCTTWLRINGWRRVESDDRMGRGWWSGAPPKGNGRGVFQVGPKLGTWVGTLAQNEGVAAGGSGQATQAAGSGDDGCGSAEDVRPTQGTTQGMPWVDLKLR